MPIDYTKRAQPSAAPTPQNAPPAPSAPSGPVVLTKSAPTVSLSKNAGDFLPLLELKTPIVPAIHRNNSGIIGAASLAGD